MFDRVLNKPLYYFPQKALAVLRLSGGKINLDG